ncbi:chemotaxis protein CheD [Roseinatronobacter alkalisoli]|uniref:Probable chemoreceptor glutamine deamidase CheD n=1 Tax=Roseinatronobacter alkalisoli TaxID=3028235 RepID=A0ABT5TBB4_9RHOB|nr:chemotaxis protein CheD [Roseinatronobacter sp. HJB301]MDD7972412.1 chemotaxis protein CheD [Roseinatronobacter sp. HJB301]
MTGPQNKVIHIVQGEHQISGQPGTVITTVLGSCVAACIYDPECGIGGMNHFLLPESASGSGDIRYAAAAMEVLINGLLRQGALRNRMQAKLFGGARMIPTLPDIGRRNAEMAQRILQNDGIRVVSGDLCGNEARRIRFWPTTGRVQMQLLGNEAPPPAEKPVRTAPGEVELF